MQVKCICYEILAWELKIAGQVSVSEELLEYLVKRTLNVHRIFSNIPDDIAVDFQVEFRSMLSGRAMKAQTLSKSSEAFQESPSSTRKRFSEDSFKGLSM